MCDLNKKIKEAEAKLTELKKVKEEITNEYEDLVLTSNKRYTDPSQLNKEHIKLLKTYNELRDTGLKLAHLVSEEKNCPVSKIFEEIQITMKDE